MHHGPSNRWRGWSAFPLFLAAATVLLLTGCSGSDEPVVPVASASPSAVAGAVNETATPTATAASTATAAPSRTATVNPSPTTRTGAATVSPSPTTRAGTATVGRSTPAAAVVTPAPDTPNPCTLVTVAEVETALGGRPFPGSMRRSRDSAEVRCTFDYLGGGDPRTVVVSVWKGTEAKPVYELRQSVYSQGGSVEQVRGLGDRAFVVQGDEGWVNVLKGDVYLSVQVTRQSLNAPDRSAQAMMLARAAVGRL
jgi:hypothetical protein